MDQPQSPGGFIPPSPSAATSATLHSPTLHSPAPAPTPQHTQAPLSTAQERRLIAYLDEHFLQVNKGYRKRHQPTSPLRTLPAYIRALHPLLALILLIPPLDPSAALRVSYLLRLTSDVTSALPGYALPPAQAGEALGALVRFLGELDAGWAAVLVGERWDPARREGVGMTVGEGGGALSQPVSATAKIRLRSMLLAAKESIAHWLAAVVDLEPGTQVDVASSFWRTLAALGDVPLPATATAREEGSEDEDAEDLLEVVMEDDPELEL